MSDPELPLPCAYVDGEAAPERADHFFDGWLTVAPGSALASFVEFFTIVLDNEVQRQRKRKGKDTEASGPS